MSRKGIRPIWNDERLEKIEAALLIARTWWEAGIIAGENPETMRQLAAKYGYKRPIISKNHGGDRRSAKFQEAQCYR